MKIYKDCVIVFEKDGKDQRNWQVSKLHLWTLWAMGYIVWNENRPTMGYFQENQFSYLLFIFLFHKMHGTLSIIYIFPLIILIIF